MKCILATFRSSSKTSQAPRYRRRLWCLITKCQIRQFLQTPVIKPRRYFLCTWHILAMRHMMFLNWPLVGVKRSITLDKRLLTTCLNIWKNISNGFKCFTRVCVCPGLRHTNRLMKKHLISLIVNQCIIFDKTKQFFFITFFFG